MERSIPLALALTLLLVPGRALTAETTVTHEEALALARERGPALLAARMRIDEARGELAGASVLLRSNPVLATEAGPRWSSDGNTVDYGAGLSQELELGGQRSARIAAAQAGVTRETAAGQEAARALLREVSVAFWRALYSEERVRLARASQADAAETLAAAQRRFDAGEIAVLEVNAARTAHARSQAELRSAEAVQASALGELAILLGIEGEVPLHPAGELGTRGSYELDALLARVDERPDLRVIAAELERAEAETRLGASLAWPELGLSAAYAHDDRDDVVRGGASFTLPIFDRGQGTRAAAAARAGRLRLELAARRAAAATEVRTHFESHLRRVDAVEVLEREALPAVADNESLARRSFEAGELGLLDLLVLRREAVATRLDHLDRRLDAALAATELEASAGVLR